MKKRVMGLVLAAAVTMTACSGGNNTQQAPANDASDTTAASGDEAPVTGSEEKGGTGDKVTLNMCWWGNQTRNDVTKQAVDLYMEQNPNIEIKIEFTDWSGYWDKLSAMAAGGNLPDIIQQDYAYINQWQQSGQLADLSEFINSGIIDTSDIPESILESGTIDGKVYALSLGSNAPMIIYDKESVEKAGVDLSQQMTMEDFYDVSQKIYETTGVKTVYQGHLEAMQMTARAHGKSIIDEITAGDDSDIRTTYEWADKIYKSDFCIAPDLLAEKNPAVVETKPIIDGITWNDSAYSNQFIAVSNTAGREFGIAFSTTFSDAAQQPLYLKPSMFFSISESSQHKEEAAKFLDWFTNSIECNRVLKAERGVPINTKVAEALKPEMDEMTQNVFDYIAKVSEIATPIDPPSPSGSGEINAKSQTIAEDLSYGDITVDEAVEEFMAEAKRILDENAK